MEQIARFYAKHLPLSREMAKNLQSFEKSSSDLQVNPEAAQF